MERIILHSDLNNFYASAECVRYPHLSGKPVAVCGDPNLRHGIVLAKNEAAKKYGVKTGDVIWEAMQKCASLEIVPADFSLYKEYSRRVRNIYLRYTDLVESFGIDECWLDVTASVGVLGGGKVIADSIRDSIKRELSITASVGVSWNKIFAKLASDLKKPDATTVISRENYKKLVFPLPVENLLYVGRATKAKLKKLGIYTIGDIAGCDLTFLKNRLDKWGEHLWIYANGLDNSAVSHIKQHVPAKSVSNSTTTSKDLYTPEEVIMVITVLAESVASRLKEQQAKGQVISVSFQNSDMQTFRKQSKIAQPTNLSRDIIDTAVYLFNNFYNLDKPVRNVSVCVSDLCGADTPLQMDFLGKFCDSVKHEKLEYAVDGIRRRFGNFSIRRAREYSDIEITDFNPKGDDALNPWGKNFSGN